MKMIAWCLLGLVLVGCQTPPSVRAPAERARFYLESAEEPGERLILPQSGVPIMVRPKPVLTEFDFVKVELARIEMGQCLRFYLTRAAARDLKQLTAAAPGRRLVLTLGGVPFGARRIDRLMDQGTLVTFVEVPDSALPALVASLNETCAALQAAAKK